MSRGGGDIPCQGKSECANSGATKPVPFLRNERTKAGRKLLCGGGGGDTEAHFPNPPPSLAAVTGGGVQGGGARPAGPGGGGVNPTSMAQNDTHVALIILTTQMWGGGGGDYWWKKLFRAKILCSCLRRQHPLLHKTKGPTRNPISPTPPLLRRASMSPPPPPPAEQFSGRQIAQGPLVGVNGLTPATCWCGPGPTHRVLCYSLALSPVHSSLERHSMTS